MLDKSRAPSLRCAVAAKKEWSEVFHDREIFGEHTFKIGIIERGHEACEAPDGRHHVFVRFVHRTLFTAAFQPS
jgi:hypothetical protein